VEIMKKVLIGLFLVASLSVLGAKNTKKAASTQNYTKNVNIIKFEYYWRKNEK